MSISTDPFYDPLDREVDSNYCIHGTFIGNPYGGDYLCGACEEGISLDDWGRYLILQGNYRRRHTTTENFLAAAIKEIHDPLSVCPESYRNLVINIVVGMWRSN